MIPQVDRLKNKMPDYVKAILCDKSIPDKYKWAVILEEQLKRNLFEKPYLPHTENTFSKVDEASYQTETKKIYANWYYIENISHNYNHLLDFLQIYKGQLKDTLRGKILEYAEFLEHTSGKHCFDKNDKHNTNKAKIEYFEKRASKLKDMSPNKNSKGAWR